jgi:hypothetical protein
MYVVCITCVKSSVVRGPGPVVRRRSPRSLPEPAPRRPPTHTSDSAPTRRPSSHSSHPNQFAVSCPIYLYSYAPIHIRCIGFAWHVCIPEHCDYRCSLMRALRDEFLIGHISFLEVARLLPPKQKTPTMTCHSLSLCHIHTPQTQTTAILSV